jgi:hypothetical protein
MSRIGTHLDTIETWVKALQLANAPLVTDCRRQLDLFDAEDVERASFKSPAAFLVLPRFRLVPSHDGGRDAECWFVIAIANRGTPGKSADVDVIDRVIALAAALDDTTFGQLMCSGISDIESRPVLSGALETKGLSVAAVSFRQTLYRVVPGMAAVRGVEGEVGAGAQSQGDPRPFENLLDPLLTSDEQTIISSWPEVSP